MSQPILFPTFSLSMSNTKKLASSEKKLHFQYCHCPATWGWCWPILPAASKVLTLDAYAVVPLPCQHAAPHTLILNFTPPLFVFLYQDVLVEIILLNLWVLLPSDFLKPQLLNQHTGCFLMVLPVEDGKTPTKKVKVKTSHFLCHHLSLFGWDFANHQAEPVKNPPCTLQRLVQIKNLLLIGRKMKPFQQITILSASASFPIIAAAPNYSTSF